MEDAAKCTQCGQALPADAPRGLCPSCLLKAGMGDQTADVASASAFVSEPDSESTCDTIIPESPEGLARLFPQLEILGQLGEGGMGVVYKARQKQLDRLVALKLMRHRFSRDPQFAERFNREARALARLNHPNIVSVYDFGMAGGQFYFIMEYVDGVNLQQMIATKAFAPQEALAIVPKLCDALQYAHDEGVVHRDIKPANILVDKKGRVKIADFGLAKIAGIQDDKLTRTNQGMGTMQYMAPEQMENAKCVDHRADIFSLGVVFYEMLTGELPLGRFAPPSKKVQIDVRLDEIVLHTLEKEPAHRYQHVSEVKTAVEGVTSSPHAPAPVAPVPQPPIDYVNRFIGFFVTPQPAEYGKLVGIPSIIIAALVFAFMLVVEFFVPEEDRLTHEIAMVLGIVPPLAWLFLTAAWKMRQTGVTRVKVVGVTVCGLIITTHAFLWMAPPRWFFGPQPAGVISAAPASVTDSTETFYRPFRYRVIGPANYQLRMWTECWREGKLDAVAPWTDGKVYIPPHGKGLDGHYEFRLALGEKLSPNAAGKVRLERNVEFDHGRQSSGDWVANPFENVDSRTASWNAGASWTLEPGRPCILLILRGHKNGMVIHEMNPGRNEAAGLILKACFDPVTRAEQRDSLYVNGFDIASFIGETATPAAPKPKIEIRYDKTQIPSVKAPGRQDYAFTFAAPAEHVLSVWMEFWQDGKLEFGNLDETARTKKGKPLAGLLRLSIADGATMSAESAGKKRYDWSFAFADSHAVGGFGDGSSSGDWRKDILGFPGAAGTGGVDNSVLNNECHPKPGETVTLLWFDAYDPDHGPKEMNWHTSLCQVRHLQGKPKAAMALRARFSPAAPGECPDVSESNESNYSGLGLVRVEASRTTPAQFAIATEIGSDLRLCKTPAEAHAALVTTASTTEGRKRAEQMLSELGGAPSPNAPAEELVKTLEKAIETIHDLSPAEAKRMIPEAASIPNADFQTLTQSQKPEMADSGSTLSCILLNLPTDKASRTRAASDEFRFLGESMNPAVLARSMWKSKPQGYATAIQPEFITDCQCSTKDDTATGTVSFTAKELYSGKVEFVARRKDGSWRIEEFRLPGYGIRTVRQNDGKWRMQPKSEPPGRLAAGAASTPVPETTAADILRKMSEKYAALKAFTASGTTVTEYIPTDGSAAITRKRTFSVNLARPEYYRIAWTDENAPLVTRYGAVWNAGDGHKTMIVGKVGTPLNRELAFSASTAGNLALNVPGMFFKDDARNLPKSLANPVLLPEESVGADACQVVSADQGTNKVTLWITKKDFLLKKLLSKGIVAPSGKEPPPAADEISDESVRKMLKSMGQDSSPEAVEKMKKLTLDGIKRHSSFTPFSSTHTTIYEKIKVNDVMIKEDFEYTLPTQH